MAPNDNRTLKRIADDTIDNRDPKRLRLSIPQDTTPHKLEVLNIIRDRLPEALTDVDELLSSPIFQPQERPVLRSSRKKKIENTPVVFDLAKTNVKSVSVEEQGETINVPIVMCNPLMVALLEKAREKFLAILKITRELNRQVSRLCPRIEAGGNMGVKVQERALELIDGVEAATVLKLNLIPEYFEARADAIQKVEGSPLCVDAQLALVAFDVIELDRWKMLVEDVKYDYEKLSHFFNTNMNLIVNPRPLEDPMEFYVS